MKPKLRTLLVDIDGINTKKKYNLLKKDFQNSHPLLDDLISETENVDEMEIIALRKTIHYGGEDFEYEFIEDYFIPALDKMEKSYCENIEDSMECIYGSEANIYFIEKKMDKINKQIHEYEASEFLGDREKKLVNQKLQDLLDFLHARKEPLVRSVDNKLNFNLSLGELTYFLKLLLENNIISGISISKLMHYAEKNFQFKGKKVIMAYKQLDQYTKRTAKTTFDMKALVNFLKSKVKD